MNIFLPTIFKFKSTVQLRGNWFSITTFSSYPNSGQWTNLSVLTWKCNQLREGFNKKIINFMEFSKLAGPPPPPPYFGKLLRMTRCFDLWHLKIRGVTFNYSLFWSGEGEGGVKYGHFWAHTSNFQGSKPHLWLSADLKYFFPTFKDKVLFGPL